MVEIPANRFYQQHFTELHTIADVCLVNWLTSIELERRPKSENDRRIAFVIRSDYCNFLLRCIVIVGGWEHARKVWPEVRRYWHAEGFEQYEAALERETAARIGH